MGSTMQVVRGCVEGRKKSGESTKMRLSMWIDLNSVNACGRRSLYNICIHLVLIHSEPLKVVSTRKNANP